MITGRSTRRFTGLACSLFVITCTAISTGGASASEIFSDDFETGDTSRWSLVVGLAGTAELNGFVWNDWIDNGEQDYGFEGPLRDWVVYLDADSSGTFGLGIDPWTRVDAFGFYSFGGLHAGSYEVRLDVLGGWTLGLPAAGSYPVTLVDDEIVGNLDFTARRLPNGWDYGDAPDPTYPTIFQHGGPSHLVGPGLRLGAGLDGEPGYSSVDDGADEDGVTFTSALVRGQTASANVTALGDGLLNVWIDLDRDGRFAPARDHVIADLPLTSGTTGINFPIPNDAGFGPTYIRFRFSTTPGLGYGGSAQDGEVEDYQVTVQPEYPNDFGDAPDDHYNTYGGSGGPYHTLVVDTFLGDNVDGEVNGQPHVESRGDDLAWFDDEDGVEFTSHLVPGDTATITVDATTVGYLDAWVDFNDSTDWNPSDQIVAVGSLVRGPNFFTFTVPGGTTDGDKVSRFRMSHQGGVSPHGPLDRGEVEDYGIEVEYLDWGDAPDIDEGPFITKLNAVDAERADDFGAAVDVDGDVTVVGAWFEGDYGAAYMFRRIGGAWVEEDKLTRSDAYRFGYDVAVEGLRTVIGQYGSSRAFVYEFDGALWALKATLTAADSGRYDALGKAVDLSGSRIITGAANHEQDGQRVGAVYIFEEDGGAWTEEAKLMEPEGDHGDRFGSSVAMDGDRAVVGAPGDDDPRETGAAFVFVRSGAVWTLEQKLTASEPTPGLWFGSSVAIDGDRLAIGSSARTYFFQRDGAGVWQEQQTLTGGGRIDGTSDISGDWMATGSYGDDTEGVNAGVARLYRWNGNQWELWKKISALDPDHGHDFGESVAIDGMRAVIGAGGANKGEVDLTGAAYVFDWLIDEDHYPTLAVNDGAYHTLNPVLRLGSPAIDMEADGRPNSTAQGDDASGIDDEDGVVFTSPVVKGQVATLDIGATGPGLLNAWIDFNNDGDWDDQQEHVFQNRPLILGINALSFPVPPWAVTTIQSDPTFGRFRFSTVGNLGTSGHAPDGEIEDHPIIIEEP